MSDESPDDPAERRREAAERLRIAEAYRERRTRELLVAASAAVGSEVEIAARFQPTSTGTLAMSMPFVGMVLSPLMRLSVPKPLRRVEMLALGEDELYAISRGSGPEAERKLLARWPRESARIEAIGSAGTETAVTFTAKGDPERFRLYCSSLRTNPWASDLVRRLGGDPPEPIDPTKLTYDATDLPTV